MNAREENGGRGTKGREGIRLGKGDRVGNRKNVCVCVCVGREREKERERERELESTYLKLHVNIIQKPM